MAISKKIVTKKKIDINKNRISGQSDKKREYGYIYETRKRFSIVEKKKKKQQQVHSYQHDHFGFMTFT